MTTNRVALFIDDFSCSAMVERTNLAGDNATDRVELSSRVALLGSTQIAGQAIADASVCFSTEHEPLEKPQGDKRMIVIRGLAEPVFLWGMSEALEATDETRAAHYFGALFAAVLAEFGLPAIAAELIVAMPYRSSDEAERARRAVGLAVLGVGISGYVLVDAHRQAKTIAATAWGPVTRRFVLLPWRESISFMAFTGSGNPVPARQTAMTQPVFAGSLPLKCATLVEEALAAAIHDNPDMPDCRPEIGQMLARHPVDLNRHPRGRAILVHRPHASWFWWLSSRMGPDDEQLSAELTRLLDASFAGLSTKKVPASHVFVTAIDSQTPVAASHFLITGSLARVPGIAAGFAGNATSGLCRWLNYNNGTAPEWLDEADPVGDVLTRLLKPQDKKGNQQDTADGKTQTMTQAVDGLPVREVELVASSNDGDVTKCVLSRPGLGAGSRRESVVVPSASAAARIVIVRVRERNGGQVEHRLKLLVNPWDQDVRAELEVRLDETGTIELSAHLRGSSCPLAPVKGMPGRLQPLSDRRYRLIVGNGHERACVALNNLRRTTRSGVHVRRVDLTQPAFE